MDNARRIEIALPAWAARLYDKAPPAETERQRMAVAIELARLNVAEGTGGPFGAAVFNLGTGELTGVGMNLVLARNNSVLHAEVVALMMAEQAVGSFDLGGDAGEFELVTSCEPCAMCLGAVHWSGVRRLVIGARREDVERIRFDEGPVFPASYEYLESRGLTVTRDVCRAEAVEVLERYARDNGVIY
jgi:tRNA(Arg) A34 adenosine deaminase TadA